MSTLIPGRQARVAAIPDCDVCKRERGDKVPAYADASIPKRRGVWGYVCRTCFDTLGCKFGTGRGQVLVLPD